MNRLATIDKARDQLFDGNRALKCADMRASHTIADAVKLAVCAGEMSEREGMEFVGSRAD